MEEAVLCRKALHQPVVEAADSDLEMDELLRDTPESGISPVPSPDPETPLTPGAARTTTEAGYCWRTATLAEGSSNPRTPSPDIELEDILEFKAAAQRDPTPEPRSEVFEFRAPEPEQLNEAEVAAQIRPDHEHLNEIFEFRVPEPAQQDERFKSRGAARINPDQEQLDDGLTER